MARLFALSCRDAGVDCDFETRGEDLEAVIRHCAEHAAQEHGMKGFGPELYTKMRAKVKTVEE